MSGGRSGRRPRRSSSVRLAGVAAFVLFIIAIFVHSKSYNPPLPVAMPFPLPAQFWTILLLTVALGLTEHLWLSERELKRAWQSRNSQTLLNEPELRPHGPMTSGPQEFEFSITGGPGNPTGAGATGVGLPQLLEWIDSVSMKISQWSATFGEPPQSASPPSVDPIDEPLHPSTRTTLAKVGGWSELRARAAVAKYLRDRPWAPPNDIARALKMD